MARIRLNLIKLIGRKCLSTSTLPKYYPFVLLNCLSTINWHIAKVLFIEEPICVFEIAFFAKSIYKYTVCDNIRANNC